jgi:hypothetical protein
VSNQPCAAESCPRDAIWWLVAEDAGHRPPQRAFSCDDREHLILAIGAIMDELMVSAGAINFQVSEDGFPTLPSTAKP